MRPPRRQHDRQLPRPDDPSFRVACNEIADQLSKSWRFKVQVIGTIVVTILVIAVATSGFVGWNISSSLQKARKDFQDDAKREIGKARDGLEAEIAEQFKKENVQRTMEQAAAKESGVLLKRSVEPSITEFQLKLDKSRDDLEKRFSQFNEVITKNEEKSSANVDSLRTELIRLQKRNNLTALADKAISEGNVAAYRQLEELAKSPNADERDGVGAELFRVFNAYSVFSGVSRTTGIELDAAKVSPKKTKEEELEVNELLPLLKVEDEPMVRVKIAELISAKAKHGSYKTSEALIDALRRESNLEVIKVLGAALRRTTGHEKGDKLDFREMLTWWDANKERLKREDTDVSPSPTPTPSN